MSSVIAPLGESRAVEAPGKVSSKRRAPTLRNAVRALVLPAIILVLWQYLSQQGSEFAFAFVPLRDIWHSFRELLATGELPLQVLASLLTAVKGLVVGGATGLAIGSLMGFSRVAESLLGPIFHAMRHVPNVALIPLVVLWFGNTELSKLLVVSLSVFEVMVLNTFEGLHAADRRLLDVGRVLTLSRLDSFRYIKLPAALPSICTGVQHAIAFAWLSTVSVELLFLVGPGLGTVMERGQMAARMDTVIVCLAFIAILGFSIHQLSIVVSRRLLRWRNAAFER